MEYQENAGLFMQFGDLLFPGGYALGFYHLIGSRQVTSYAKARGGFAAAQYFLEHGVIAERRFDKQLRLFQAFGRAFQLFDPFGAL